MAEPTGELHPHGLRRTEASTISSQIQLHSHNIYGFIQRVSTQITQRKAQGLF